MNDSRINFPCAWEFNSTSHSLYYKYFVSRTIGHIILVECIAVVGLIVALFGYRFIKMAMFFTGFILGFAVFYVFSPRFIDTKFCCTKKGRADVHIMASSVVGVITGVFVTRLYRIGVFIIGKCLGLLIALLLLQTPIGIYFTSFTAVGSLITSSAMLFGSLTCKYEKPFAILSTSFSGSYAALCGVDVFLRSAFSFSIYAIFIYLKESVKLDEDSTWLSGGISHVHMSNCWASRSSMIMFGSWVALSLLCCLLQYQVTAKNLTEGGDICPFSFSACVFECCENRHADPKLREKGTWQFQKN